MSLNKHHLIYKYGGLTHPPSTSFFIEPEVTFQMIGTDPGFIRLSVPFTWTARVKQSVSKCSEHIPNVPVGLKFFRCSHTNLLNSYGYCLTEKYALKCPILYRRLGCNLALHSVLEAF